MFQGYVILAVAFLAQAYALPKGSSLFNGPLGSASPTLIGVSASHPISREGRLAPPGPSHGLAAGVASILFPFPLGGGLNTTLTSTTNHGAPSNISSVPSPGPSSNTVDPATLLLCENAECGSCLGFDLNTAQRNQCLIPSVPNFQFLSVAVIQPSDRGLSFAVAVSPGGCADFSDIPIVNTCFDVPNLNQPYTEFALITGP